MIKTISRSPNDHFTFDLYTNLLSKLTCDFEAYYIWSDPPYALEGFIKNTKFTKSNVVIGIKDLLDLWKDYNFWHDTAQAGIRLLDDMAVRHPDKNFVIFNSLENINLESTATNIQYVQWGGDIVNQADSYQHVKPVLDKNFNSKKTFISLNRNRRAHRLVLLSYLFGKEYNQFGNITYLGQQIDVQNFDNLLDCISWEFETQHDNARQAMLSGYTQFYNNKELAVDDYKIYKTINDNVTNFNQCLRTKYQNSFVEIVTESSFAAPAYMITEKFLNSVYGCNFPILLSGSDAVAHLRNLGFDMFDDIVDHSYDDIPNPIDRIVRAVDHNKKLLTDVEYAKDCWKTNQYRFERNVDLAKIKLYSWYQNRAIDQFNKIKWA